MKSKTYVWLALGAAAMLLVISACQAFNEERIQINFVTPTDGQRFTPGPVPMTVRAVTNQPQLDSVQFYVDGGLIGAVRTGDHDTFRLTWDALSATPGRNYKLRAVGSCLTDMKNRYRDSTTITVRIDTGGPVVRILAPADGESLARGVIPVRAWARDSFGGGMDKVEFYVDEVLGGTVNAGVSDTYRWAWNDSQATATSHSIKAKAYNQNGDKMVDEVTVFVKGGGSHHGPTHHYGSIFADEIWWADGNPHLIDGDIQINNNALVTIMPACTVKFSGPHRIWVGFPPQQGGIKAVGLPNAPILFTSGQSSPHPGDWVGIQLDSGTSSVTQFSYCTFEYGGYYAGGSNILVRQNQAAAFENCTIRNSRFVGIYCQSAAFSSFHNNTITANGTYPIAVTPDLIPAIGSDNSLTGNGEDGIDMLAGNVTKSTTWPALSVPYILWYPLMVGDATNHPVLTIAPGCSLKFKGASLTAFDGDIVADGSSGRIVFTVDTNPPAWGKFYGIAIGNGRVGDTISGTRFIECSMSYGGNPISQPSGNIRINGTRPVIRNCEINHGCHFGVVLYGQQVPDTAVLRMENSFTNNDSGDFRWLH
jgi:hypothetical protein